MNCEVMTRGDLEAYVFNEMDGSDARRVESHLFGCTECAAEMRRLREERRLFRSRAEAVTAEVPSFEDLLARIDAGGGLPISEETAEPPRRTSPSSKASKTSKNASSEAERALRLPVSARAAAAASSGPVSSGPERSPGPSHRSSRGVGVTSALLALAAAFVGLWMRTTPPPVGQATSPAATEEALIGPDPTCTGPDDETVRIPVSQEPTASIDPSLSKPMVPVVRAPDPPPTCESDTCVPSAEVASSCESCAGFCAPTEP